MWTIDETRPKKTSGGLQRALAIRKLENVDGEPIKIESGIFVGSIGAAHNLPSLKALGITHILCLGRNMPAQFPDDFEYKVGCLLVSYSIPRERDRFE